MKGCAMKTSAMKKLVAVVMSLVLVFAFTPTTALANLSVGSGDFVNAASEQEPSANGASAEGAQAEMTAQSKSYDWGYDRWMNYEDYADEESGISGVVITEIGVPTHYYGPEGENYLTVPAEIDGKPVVGIGADADHPCVTTNLNYTDKVFIPKSVRFVYGLYFNSQKDGVEFESGSPVTDLYYRMFHQYDGATVKLPDALTKIPAEMFVQSQLESITLPAATLSIDRQAFVYSSKLASVTFNEGLQTIGVEAFAHIPSSGYYYGDFPHIASISIPNSVTDIDEAAFRKVTTLSSASFGTSQQASNLQHIGNRAFFGTNLANVAIPDAVTTIGKEAFSGTNEYGGYDGEWGGQHVLASLQLGSSQSASQLTSLGSKAFAKQPITSVALPNTLKSLGYDASTFQFDDNGNLLEQKGDNTSVLGAFSHCDKLATIIWPAEYAKGFTTVGGFDGCTSLTGEAVSTLPSWVTGIDDYAFYNCTAMDNVVVPATVESIGKGAFSKNQGEAITGDAPVFTLQNPDVSIDWGEDITKGPWPLECGYTIKYPASVGDDTSYDIVKYRNAVEAYEQAKNTPEEKRTKFNLAIGIQYTVTGVVPEGASVTLIASDEVIQPALDNGNSFSVRVEGDKYVGAIVSLEGYADYRVSPDANANLAIIGRNWDFTVTVDDMQPLSMVGTLQVSTIGDYRANCNVAVFERKADGSAGKLVSQGSALRASQSSAEVAPAYIVDEILAGDYIVVGWQENELFSRVSGIADFAAMGFSADDYVQAEVTIEAGKVSELKLEIPELDTSAISAVLATGDVTVASSRALPGVPFVVTIRYDMTTGQSVESVQVRIPEGLLPLAAATNAKEYYNAANGVNGGSWDQTQRVLTIKGLDEADRQSGKVALSLKATEPGSFAISASLKSGSATAPIGTASVECPAIQLVVPQGTLASREFAVHVYAAPNSVMELKIGDTVLSQAAKTMDVAECKTNLVGHAKVNVTIPDEEISLSPYYQVTATLKTEGSHGERPSDVAVVQYNAMFGDVPIEPTVHDFWFESAGDTVDLAKDGQDVPGFYILGAHHDNFTRNMPFTAVIDSLQPLEEEATLYLGMLDNSVNAYAMHLTESSNLKSGAKRYTYKAIVTITDDDRFDASEVPCRFDVLPMPLMHGAAKAPDLSQANVDALNAAINASIWDSYARGEAAFKEFYNEQLTDAQRSLLTGVSLIDADLGNGVRATQEYLDSIGYDYAFGVFNNSFRHTTWDPDGVIWNSGALTASDKREIEAAEEKVAAAFDYLAVLMGNSKPMYEYKSFDEYVAAEYGYPGVGEADPDQLARNGYRIFYDKAGNIEWPGDPEAVAYNTETDQLDYPDRVKSTSAWYGVDPSAFGIASALETQDLAAQGATELATLGDGDPNDGSNTGSVVGNLGSKIHWYTVHMAEDKLSQGDINTVVAEMTDLSGIISGKVLGESGAACVGRGALSGFGFFWSAKSCADNAVSNSVISSEHNTRNNELKRINDMYEWYKAKGLGNSDCARALLQESDYLGTYVGDLSTASKIAEWSNFIGTTSGTVGGAAGTAAEALAIKAAADPEPESKAALGGAATICGGISLTCAGISAANVIGTAAAGQLLIPNISDHKAIVDNYRFYRERVCKKDAFGKLHYDKRPIIDPSGYTYEGVEGNRISGVIATIYQKIADNGDDGDWAIWDANAYDQENPQTTNSAGLFAWDVPEGDWKVLFQKDGYDNVWSQVMHVLPVWTDVAINMIRSAAPAGAGSTANLDDPDDPYVVITFDQYMKAAGEFAPTVTVGGVPATNVTWLNVTTGTDEEGNEAPLSLALRVSLAGLVKPGDTANVVVAGAFSYGGKQMTAPYSATATIPAPKPTPTPTPTKSDLADYIGKARAAGFTDLKDSDWYMKVPEGAFPGTQTLYLDYAVARGLMSGYAGTTLFGPDDDLNRAQAATVLYRLANPDSTDTNVPADYAGNKSGLPDVESGKYYTAAVNWCVAKGVITGYGEPGKYYAFGPDDKVTREQLATMIARYCTGPAAQPAATADITSFSDYSAIAPWAREGVAYCVANSIVSGYSDGSHRFGPADKATRCQMAKIIAVTARMLE